MGVQLPMDNPATLTLAVRGYCRAYRSTRAFHGRNAQVKREWIPINTNAGHKCANR